jgi:hypothetical protein
MLIQYFLTKIYIVVPALIIRRKEMDNRILLVGSILFVTLFLITPSIPAIQLNASNTTTQRYLSDLKTEIQTPTNKNILELPENRTLLYLFVMSITYFWLIRFYILLKISTEPSEESPIPYITHPLIFIRAAFLLNRIDWWLIMWDEISKNNGWGWE